MFCFWPLGSHSILLAEGKVGCAVWVWARRLRLANLLHRAIDPRREGGARQSARTGIRDTHQAPGAHTHKKSRKQRPLFSSIFTTLNFTLSWMSGWSLREDYTSRLHFRSRLLGGTLGYPANERKRQPSQSLGRASFPRPTSTGWHRDAVPEKDRFRVKVAVKVRSPQKIE